MADALRAAAQVPGFLEAVDVWLVETSQALRATQREAVPTATHASSLADVLPGPMLLVANEFFDALPIRQFRHVDGRWHERQIGLDGDRLVWGLGPAAGALPENAPDGAVLEVSAASAAVGEEIGRRLARSGGAALLIDYGAEPPVRGGGDTLQAVRGHQPVDTLETPGLADLTAHVDFTALAESLRAGGAAVAPLLEQGALLDRLGIAARARALAARNPDRAAEIDGQCLRLKAPDQMGRLFKALAAAGPQQPPLPCFEAGR
jgi:SAM-dependent MidA family methyltransferase